MAAPQGRRHSATPAARVSLRKVGFEQATTHLQAPSVITTTLRRPRDLIRSPAAACCPMDCRSGSSSVQNRACRSRGRGLSDTTPGKGGGGEISRLQQPHRRAAAEVAATSGNHLYPTGGRGGGGGHSASGPLPAPGKQGTRRRRHWTLSDEMEFSFHVAAFTA